MDMQSGTAVLGETLPSPSNSVDVDLNDSVLDDLISLNSDAGSVSPELWRLANAVHMEVQENAKLPTFNWSVDRSNAVDGTDTFITHLKQPPMDPADAQLSLSEKFLNPKKRDSYHQNYQNYKSVLDDKTPPKRKHVEEESSNVAPAEAPVSDGSIPLPMTVDVDPTPLSEIKRQDELSARHMAFSPAHTALPVPGASQVINRNDSQAIDIDPIALAAKIVQQEEGHQPLANSVPYSITAGRPRPEFTVTNATKHSAAATLSAAERASRYGFGSKHVVPSVPAAGVARPKKKAKPLVLTSRRMSSTGSQALPNGAGKSVEAYERKKQRAKDARVKLNDSIDRLAISINLAGTQSKERLAKWNSLPNFQSEASRKTGVEIMQECSHSAETARKWDRPSFVGTAAKLIQSLNSQCETLMRELAAVSQSSQLYPAVAVNATMQAPPNGVIRSQARRNGESADGSIFAHSKIVSLIAEHLDPLALVRCNSVCRTWRNVGIFTADKVWEPLTVARFGHYNIRQWKANADDDTAPSKSFQRLYKAMDDSNAMPHMVCDGLVRLGEGKLVGAVSAWSYLVERSNGETLRSVRRQESMKGSGIFISLPVVELRTVIQNTGSNGATISLRKHVQVVDSSTRRRGEEMREIDWDERFHKRVLSLDGTQRVSSYSHEEVYELPAFDSVVVVTFIHAKGCSTISKFIDRSNFTRVLIQLTNGTTVPLVIPFPRANNTT